jgi:hypothetical protein
MSYILFLIPIFFPIVIFSIAFHIPLDQYFPLRLLLLPYQAIWDTITVSHPINVVIEWLSIS